MWQARGGVEDGEKRQQTWTRLWLLLLFPVLFGPRDFHRHKLATLCRSQVHVVHEDSRDMWALAAGRRVCLFVAGATMSGRGQVVAGGC